MTDWKQDGGFASWDEAVARVRELQAENERLRAILRPTFFDFVRMFLGRRR